MLGAAALVLEARGAGLLLAATAGLARRPSPRDRRVQIVRLTAEGRRAFRAMARANADWIAELFAGLTSQDTDALMRLLGKAKSSARRAIDRRNG